MVGLLVLNETEQGNMCGGNICKIYDVRIIIVLLKKLSGENQGTFCFFVQHNLGNDFHLCCSILFG